MSMSMCKLIILVLAHVACGGCGRRVNSVGEGLQSSQRSQSREPSKVEETISSAHPPAEEHVKGDPDALEALPRIPLTADQPVAFQPSGPGVLSSQSRVRSQPVIAQGNQVADLKKDLAAMKKELSAANKELDRAKKEANKIPSMKEKLEESLNAQKEFRQELLIATRDLATASRDAKQIPFMTEKLEESRSSQALLREELSAAKLELIAANRDVAQAKRDVTAADKEAEKLPAMQQKLEAKLEESANREKDLKAQIANLQKDLRAKIDEKEKELTSEIAAQAEARKGAEKAKEELSRQMQMSKRELTRQAEKDKKEATKDARKEIEKLNKEREQLKGRLNTTIVNLATTQDTLQLAIAQKKEMQDKVQSFSDLQEKIKRGDNLMASELALARYEVEELRARELELNVQVQLQDKRLASIRSKAVETLGVEEGNQIISVEMTPAESIEETAEMYRTTALQLVAEKAKDDAFSTALLLGEAEQSLSVTQQNALEFRRESDKLQQKMTQQLNQTAQEKAQVEADFSKLTLQKQELESIKRGLSSRLSTVEGKLAEETISAKDEKQIAERSIAELRDNLEKQKQELVLKEEELADLAAELGVAKEGWFRKFRKFIRRRLR